MLKWIKNLAKNQTSKGFALGVAFVLGIALVEAPPAKFIPTQTSANVIFAPPNEVSEVCSKGHPFRAVACAKQLGPNRGFVIMPHPCDPSFKQDDYALLLCHELAHLKGWRHND